MPSFHVGMLVKYYGATYTVLGINSLGPGPTELACLDHRNDSVYIIYSNAPTLEVVERENHFPEFKVGQGVNTDCGEDGVVTDITWSQPDRMFSYGIKLNRRPGEDIYLETSKWAHQLKAAKDE